MIEDKPASHLAEPVIPKEEEPVVEVIDVEEEEMEVVETVRVDTKLEKKPPSQNMNDEIMKQRLELERQIEEIKRQIDEANERKRIAMLTEAFEIQQKSKEASKTENEVA